MIDIDIDAIESLGERIRFRKISPAGTLYQPSPSTAIGWQQLLVDSNHHSTLRTEQICFNSGILPVDIET